MYNNKSNAEIIDKLYETFFNYVAEIRDSIKTNSVAREALTEAFYLKSDLVDLIRDIISSYKASDAANSSFLFATLMIVNPAADHLLAAFMTGALPFCYQAIRVSLEALTMGYYADASEEFRTLVVERPENELALRKLDALQNKLDKEKISITSFMKDYLPVNGETKKHIIKIWSKSSNDFLHFKGYILKFTRPGDPSIPSYFIGSFLPYSQDDEKDLNDFCETLRELRTVLKTLYTLWRLNFRL